MNLQLLMSSSNGGGITPTTFDFTKLSIKYNNTDFSYLTDTATWSDTTLGNLRNVISITTVASDQTDQSTLNACTGLTYYEKTGVPDQDELAIKTIYPNEIGFVQRSNIATGTSIPSHVRNITATQLSQGLGFDSVNLRLFEDQATSVRELDLSGSVIATGTRAGGVGAQLYFDQDTGDLYVTSDTNQPVQRWRRVSGNWVLQETYWYGSSEGGAKCKVFDKFVSQLGTLREQDTNTGLRTRMWGIPLTSSENEGLVVDPRDGTMWKCSDDYFHGNIVNGNRLIHFDPRGVYNKWLRFPHTIRYNKWKLTSALSGSFGSQKLNGNDWNISPVIDFGAFTGQQSLSNYYNPMSADLEFRGSASAPTTTSETYFNLASYDANSSNDGWGATVPGSWQSTPVTNRYMQIRVKPKATTPPATIWTPASLITKPVWTDMVGFNSQYGDKEYDFYANTADEPTAGLFRVNLAINKGNTANNWTQVTQTNQPTLLAASNYITFAGANVRHFNLTTIAPILALSTAHLHIVGRRTASTNTAIFLAAHNTANSNDRLLFCWLPNNHATFANGIVVIHNDGAGVVSMYGVASTRTDFPLITYELGQGGINGIRLDGVSQTLTVISGSNTGQCFDDIPTANSIRVARIQGGTAAPLTVRDGSQDMKMILINDPAETNFTNLLAYAATL